MKLRRDRKATLPIGAIVLVIVVILVTVGIWWFFFGSQPCQDVEQYTITGADAWRIGGVEMTDQSWVRLVQYNDSLYPGWYRLHYVDQNGFMQGTPYQETLDGVRSDVVYFRNAGFINEDQYNNAIRIIDCVEDGCPGCEEVG